MMSGRVLTMSTSEAMTGGRNRRGRAPRPFEYYRMIHAKKDYKGEAFNVLHDTMQITDTKGEAFDCIPTLGKA